MTTLNCICRPSTLVLNQFQTFQCFSCGIFAHMSCYEYSPTEITKLFCIKCRLKILEPFYEFLEFLIPPVLLPKNKQINEIFKFFLDKSALKTSILGIICTKIVFPENNNFLYEWPSENITLSLNKTFLKYQMSSYLTITDEKIIYMNNSLEIDYKEILKDSSVFGVCLLEKKDYKTVAKEIAQMNQLTAEEARKNFEKLKIKDVEVNNQFPIKDPLTFNMIVLPARGTLCLHPACFDLLSFLQININGSKFRWKCPICKQSLKIIDIVIDSHLHKILKTLKRDYNGKEGELEKIEYICFDEEGNWKAKQNFSEEWGNDLDLYFVLNNYRFKSIFLIS